MEGEVAGQLHDDGALGRRLPAVRFDGAEDSDLHRIRLIFGDAWALRLLIDSGLNVAILVLFRQILEERVVLTECFRTEGVDDPISGESFRWRGERRSSDESDANIVESVPLAIQAHAARPAADGPLVAITGPS